MTTEAAALEKQRREEAEGRRVVEVRLASKLPPDLRRVAEVIGLRPAVLLARAFRGDTIYVGTIDALEREARDSKIRRDFDRGLSMRTIGNKYGLSRRQIWNIVNRPGEDTTEIVELLRDVKL